LLEHGFKVKESSDVRCQDAIFTHAISRLQCPDSAIGTGKTLERGLKHAMAELQGVSRRASESASRR